MGNHDDIIRQIFFTQNNRIKNSYIKLINNYPNIKSYLLNRYKCYESIQEILWRINLNIETRPTCLNCGSKVKYLPHGSFRQFCSKKCAAQGTKEQVKLTNLQRYGVTCSLLNKEVDEKRKKTWLHKYGCENPFGNKDIIAKSKRTCLEKYGNENYKNEEKRKITFLKKYGVVYPSQLESCQKASHSKEAIEKSRQTCLKKYGVINVFKLERVKTILRSDEKTKKQQETCLRKYGTKNFSQSDIYYANVDVIKNKILETKRKNNTFNTSKSEEILYKKLVNKYGKDDVIRQYKSEAYPFACDFYIKSKDLYVELQGMWTHGKHAFNSDSEEDRLVLEQWKEKAKTSRFYKNAIKTWTIRDVNKRQLARENNLNWIEIFDINNYKI